MLIPAFQKISSNGSLSHPNLLPSFLAVLVYEKLLTKLSIQSKNNE